MKTGIKIKFKVFIVFFLLICSAATVFAGVKTLSVGAQTDSYSFSKADIADVYYVGDKVNVGKVTVNVAGTEYDADSVVYSPDGSAKVTDNFVVAEVGEYTIGLRAQVNGKLYSEDIKFTAVGRLYSVNSDKSSVKYGTDESKYQTGKKGLLLSLANNDEFTLNQIIDLKELDKDDVLIRLFSTPKTQGAYDTRRFYVKLTDAYNPEIYMAIRVQCYPYDGGAWSYQNSYVTIEFTGYNSDDDFGIPLMHSFYAKGYSPVGEEFVTLGYDYATSTVYANGSCESDRGPTYGNLTDDQIYPVAFPGFTTGEVFLSIYGVDYAASDMNMVITDIAGLKLSNTEVKYADEALITVDTGALDPNDLPYGIVNKPYPVFSASASDAYSDNVRLETKVFYNYNSLSRYESDIKNGVFYPNKTGVYTIEYTAVNAFGGKTVKTLPVEVYATGNSLEMDFDDASVIKSAKVGETVSIAAFGNEVKVNDSACGVGMLSYSVRVEKDGEEVSLSKNVFIPKSEGVYRVIYTVTDMLGQTAEIKYEVAATLESKPVFTDAIVLPKYFIANKEYVLPAISAYDYSLNKSVETVVHVTDKLGNELQLQGHSFTPNFGENSSVYVYYSAQNASGSTVSEKTEIPVRVVRKDRKTDLTQYFDMNGGNLNATDENIIFYGNADFSVTYIHPLLASSWSIDFSIVSSENAFKNFDVYLTDYENPDITVKFSVRKPDAASGLTYIYSGNEKGNGNIKSGFYDDGNIRISYDKESRELKYNAYSMPIKVTESGDPFTGFASGKVYMRFALSGVEGDAAVRLNKIGSNTFSNDTKDYVEPDIEISGNPKITNGINDLVTVYSAIAWDVLDVTTYINLTVTYNGNPVTATDGTVLKDVSCERDYTIKLTNYGRYLISYYYEDSVGNSSTRSISVYAEDEEAPVLSISDSLEVKSVGDVYTLTGVTASDNVDGNVNVRCIIRYTDGRAEVSTAETLVLEKVGKHEIVYYAEDSSGNYTMVTKTIHVR